MPASPSASVFINSPFDETYQPLFEAIIFCVSACGFVPRCTLELTDAAEVRIENIYRLIAQCNHSIHDISRTEVEDQPYRLPRFNMPLELGIFSVPNDLEDARLRNAVWSWIVLHTDTSGSFRISVARTLGRTTELRRWQSGMFVTGCNLLPGKLPFPEVRRPGRITSGSEESCQWSQRKHSLIRLSLPSLTISNSSQTG